MRMSNMFYFTEHHRYTVYRDFSMSELEQKMLSHVYQPMVGAFAISLYRLLYQHIPSDVVGFSGMDTQRKLFLLLGLELSEKGRSYFVEQTSKLEAVGLLQTSRIMQPDSEDYLFEYELQLPLRPSEFFDTQHLTLLLRDKVGKYAVLELREQFIASAPSPYDTDSVHRENISIPFYELFRLNTQVIDYELEQALQEVAPHKRSKAQAEVSTAKGGASAPVNANRNEQPDLNYADIITRFPKYSYNRSYVERLRYDREGMGILNYVARKFELTPQELCRLLDEDGVFSASDGKLLLDELQQRAHLHFRQNKRRDEWREREQHKIESRMQEESRTDDDSNEEPEVAVQMEYYLDVPTQFSGKCDIHQYNMMLRNTPYTRLLEKFFPGAVPDSFMDMFTKMDLNYKMPDEVINVLIHYLMKLFAQGSNQRLNRNFVESIVSNMLLKQVKTYEQAVQYIRAQAEAAEQQERAQGGGQASKGGSRARTSNNSRYAKPQKPVIPIVQHTSDHTSPSQADVERAMELARRLDAGRKS